MKKRQIKLEPNHANVFEIEGVRYTLKREVVGKDHHVKEIIFEEVDPEEYENKISEITDYLVNESGITAKQIIGDLLKSESMDRLKQLYRQVRNKTKVKVRKGCLNLVMGSNEITIIE